MITLILIVWMCLSFALAWLVGGFIALSEDHRRFAESAPRMEKPSTMSGDSYMGCAEEASEAIAV
jgi:hypothetical protein